MVVLEPANSLGYRNMTQIKGNDTLLRAFRPREEKYGTPEHPNALLERYIQDGCPTEEIELFRSSDLSIRFKGELVGHSDIPHPSERGKVGTNVTIWRTGGGKVITHVHQWQETNAEAPIYRNTYRGEVHTTPGDALFWLRHDSKGRMGPASFQAWERACKKDPSFGETFIYVD